MQKLVHCGKPRSLRRQALATFAFLLSAGISCAPHSGGIAAAPPTSGATPSAQEPSAAAAVPAPLDQAQNPVPLAQLPVTTPDSATIPDGEPSTNYYLRSSGNDKYSGRSRDSAWRTLARASRARLEPGDRLFLEAGSTFTGTLKIEGGSSGTPRTHVLISSFGPGISTIDAGCNDGIYVHNRGGIKISRLIVKGCGPERSTGAGIFFHNELPNGARVSFIRVDSVLITGFRKQGLLLEGTGRSGFKDVRLTRVTSTMNGLGGIEVKSQHFPYDSVYASEDVYIAYAEASDNPGIPGGGKPHTGSGIIISDVLRGMIERSRAYHNGYLSNSKISGGPVGIWAWNSSDVTLQFNESVGNRTSGRSDGGGFDLDGGVRRSVMQYNYSRENDGPAYMVMTFPDGPSTTQNVVRANVSIDDARKNGYAVIQVMGEARDIDVFGNVIVVAGTPDSVASTQGSFNEDTSESQPTGRKRQRRSRAIGRGPIAGVGVLSSQFYPDDPRNFPQKVRVFRNLLMTRLDLPFLKIDYPATSVTDSGNRLMNLGVQTR